MAKKIDVQKEPVKLREKVLKNGSISLQGIISLRYRNIHIRKNQ